MTKDTLLAIIPARAGSERIPNKNIRSFLGKPLISYAIKQAKSCGFIDRVIVDTDSPKIAKIATKFGAEVPGLRPKKLAKSNSQIIDSILFTLKRLRVTEGYEPDYILILHTTSTLRKKEDIEDCWDMMRKSKADTVLTVCPTHPRLYHLDSRNKLILVNGSERWSTNVQGWPKGYVLNGFAYLVRTSALLKEKKIITKNTRAVICPRWRSVDLDTMEDWVLAEIFYKNKNKIEAHLRKLNEKK